MGNEAKQPEAASRNKDFWFPNFHFWRGGIAVGSKVSNEVTVTEATGRKKNF